MRTVCLYGLALRGCRQMNITVTEEEAQVTATYMDALQLSNRALAKALEVAERDFDRIYTRIESSDPLHEASDHCKNARQDVRAALKERMIHDT